MTDAFGASVAAGGRTLLETITQDGSRGVGVALRDGDRSRELVTVVGPDVDAAALPEHAGWDLELVEVRPIETPSGPRTLVAERLPAGAASTRTGVGVAFATVAPQLVRRVAAAHAGDGLAGPIHPALLFLDPDTGQLLAVAQRPLHLAAVPGVEGDRPLFGYGHLSPGDLAGAGRTRADDMFRVGLALWRLRHGAHPFGNLPDASVAAAIVGIGAGTPAAALPAVDSVDAALASCFDPDPSARPSAQQLLDALGA